MRVVLVQLPLQSHDYVYSQENVPLAPGYLASFLAASGLGVDVVVCPPEVANFAGDEAIVQWLVDVRPDIVGFSSYLWNVERTLHICREAASRMDGVTFVFGGPEVNADNETLCAHPAFRTGVRGEGELAFAELVGTAMGGHTDFRGIRGLVLKGGGGVELTGPPALATDLDAIPSPYLSGVTGIPPGGGMLVETVRGCPLRCAYCHYHKSAPVVRAFSTDRVAAEIEWGQRAGAREVTIVDPCFARRPGLMDLLEAVARTRTPSMRLSCELNAEDVTAPLVEALVRAGVAHVETGLQSTNPRALAFVGRSFSRPDFIRGAHLLRSAGIHVMVDVMVGLPGDTPEDVMRSVDFVLDNDLSDELSLYPVSVLPGTVLRRRAEALGIAYLSAPPYLVTRTRDMAQGDMARVFSWCEDATGRDLFPVELPRMGDPRPGGKGGYVQRIVLEGHTNPGGLCAPGRVGQALCIELRDAAWLESDTLRGRLEGLLRANPYTLVSWVVPEGLFVHGRTLGLVRSARGPASHPADREYMSAYTPLRSHQVFLEIATSRHEKTYTLIPVDGDLSRPLWSGLPDSAGPYEEDRLARRLEEILHARPRIRFHDLEGGEAWPAARFLVSTTVR